MEKGNGFLFIKRYIGQRIFIEPDIVLRVNSYGQGQVVVAIQAPGRRVERPTKEIDRADRAEAKRIREERER